MTRFLRREFFRRVRDTLRHPRSANQRVIDAYLDELDAAAVRAGQRRKDTP